MLTSIQKSTAKALVSIFETSKINGNNRYGTVTLIQGDTGGLTYGAHQATLMSGNLYLMIKSYCEKSGADFANALSPYLDRLQYKDQSLNTDMTFRDILKQAGNDKDMQNTQDEFFDNVFWKPAETSGKNLGFEKALSFAIIYDSYIHGNWAGIRKLTESSSPVKEIGEYQWIINYNVNRRNWLANHSRDDLRRCVYRQDEFNKIMLNENWDLNLPLKVRGVNITEEALGYNNIDISNVEDGLRIEADDTTRVLYLNNPFTTGPDVLEVQQALFNLGYPVSTDGVFGNKTKECVIMFQKSVGLKADGIVGNMTKSKLGID